MTTRRDFLGRTAAALAAGAALGAPVAARAQQKTTLKGGPFRAPHV